MAVRQTTTKRFYSKVYKNGPTMAHCPELGPCWIWTAYRGKRGYGTFKTGKSTQSAHRYSWSLANGLIPDGLWVLHRCDNPSCVRPDHLFLGDAKINMEDKVAKGRQSKGATHGSIMRRVASRGERHGRIMAQVVARGEGAPMAKLTANDILEIRRQVVSGERQVDVARRFGIIQAHVSRIFRRVSWAHVP